MYLNLLFTLRARLVFLLMLIIVPVLDCCCITLSRRASKPKGLSMNNLNILAALAGCDAKCRLASGAAT